jgi:lambda family phage portal protein
MILDQYGHPITAAPSKRANRGSLRARYDAAQDTDENRKHWAWADNYSASAANSIEVRKKLRSRSRYECIEANSFAKGMALTLANDTISTGPSIQCTGDRQLGQFIEHEWRRWARAVGLANKLRTARLTTVVDGEAFILRTTNRRLRTPVQLDIKLVEADQISTPGFVDGLPNHIDGIVFDKWGQPETYHLLKGHPGDIWAFGAWEKEDIDVRDMIHLFRVDRPGQVRGIPEFTPALPLFAFLRRMTLAVIAASETAANHAAVLETMADAFDDEDGADDISPFEGVEIDRNMMTSLPRGWRMSQFKPEQPTTTYEMFRNAILNEIARCVHMPRNKALADSSSYNYSSGRLDHQTYYESIGVEQSQWEMECLDRIFEWWLDEALMLSNYLPVGRLAGAYLDQATEHEWRWNPPKHVDPGKEINAAIDAIDAGLLTEEQYLLEQNIDPEKHYEQLERQVLRKRKLASLGGVDPAGSPLPLGHGPGVADLLNQEPRTNNQEPGSSPINQEQGPSPTNEFAGMSRQQVKRNLAAMDDAFAKLTSGEWTETRARVHLRMVGISETAIDNLLAEIIEVAE